MTARLGDLNSTELESGVSAFDGHGYVRIRSIGRLEDVDVVLVGQLDPAEMRAHGLACLEAAEAAEHDAAVFAELVDMGLDQAGAAAFVGRLRDRRAQ